MSPSGPRLACAAVALLWCLTLASVAGAVCTAADVIAAAGGCPGGNGPCVIDVDLTTDQLACTLDFGARRVTLTRTLAVGSRMLNINAGELTIITAGSGASGMIDARGSAASGSDSRGGTVMIRVTGDFETQGTQRAINATGNGAAGMIGIDAGGDVVVRSQILANGNSAFVGGGSISIRAGGAVTVTSSATVAASGGNDSSGGGDVVITAQGDITLDTKIDVSGSDGGVFDILSRGTILLSDVDSHATGDAGSGGCVDAEAETALVARGIIDVTGSTGTFQTGGCGGFVCLDTNFGDAVIQSQAAVLADGARPDGGGGLFGMTVRGNVDIQGRIDVRGPVGDTCGGEVCIEARESITLGPAASIDVSGGTGGGDIDLLAGEDITTTGPIDASARQRGGTAGGISLDAGDRPASTGALTVLGSLDASSPGSCSVEEGCGEAGSFELAGCNVRLGTAAVLSGTGPTGGDLLFIARNRLRVQGTADVSKTIPGGNEGSALIQRRVGATTEITGSIKPAVETQNIVSCTGAVDDPPRCLEPCTDCGDGAVQYPEQCDPGAVPPAQCSGCSDFCEALLDSDCDDGRTCTIDFCDPRLLCFNRPVAGPCTEPPTPTPTVTGTPPTETPTPSATPTATASATPTDTATAPPSATPTASATATASPIVSDTPTVPPTAAPTATPVIPACTGDCNGNGSVNISELIIGVNIALGSRDLSACTAVDRNRDGRVGVNELITAVGAALNGC